MATKTKEQVIYAEIESTVHFKAGDAETFPDGSVHQPIESRVVLPGEIIPLDEVPSYLVEFVKENKSPGLLLLDREQADKLNDYAKLIRGEGKVTDFVDAPDPVLPEPLLGTEVKL